MERQNLVLIGAIVFLMAMPVVSCKKHTGPSAELTINKVNKTNEMSAVKMSHDKHEDAGLKCIVCHHKSDNDDRIKICSKCHKGKDGKETIHDLCINCHKEKKKGPAECELCHKK